MTVEGALLRFCPRGRLSGDRSRGLADDSKPRAQRSRKKLAARIAPRSIFRRFSFASRQRGAIPPGPYWANASSASLPSYTATIPTHTHNHPTQSSTGGASATPRTHMPPHPPEPPGLPGTIPRSKAWGRCSPSAAQGKVAAVRGLGAEEWPKGLRGLRARGT